MKKFLEKMVTISEQVVNVHYPKQLAQFFHFHCPVPRLLHLATVFWDLSQELVQWQCAVSVLHLTESHVHQQESHIPDIIKIQYINYLADITLFYTVLPSYHSTEQMNASYN